MLRKASIAGLTMDQTSNTPIIVLKVEETEQAVPIWIGLLEATSIASALQEIKFDRPMTHDLFKNFADSLEVEVTMVEVCDLRDNTFFAKIHYNVGEASYTIDSRPSDAIAIALRCKAPIYIEEAVVEKSHAGQQEAEVSDDSEEGKKWAEYLKNLSPEDFGKYKV